MLKNALTVPLALWAAFIWGGMAYQSYGDDAGKVVIASCATAVFLGIAFGAGRDAWRQPSAQARATTPK